MPHNPSEPLDLPLPWKADQVLLGDALDYLRSMPDSCVDLVIADPPYNLAQGAALGTAAGALPGLGGEWTKRLESWDNMPFSSYLDFTLAWMKECKRVLRDSGSIWTFGTYHNIGIVNTVMQAIELEIINEVIWYKRNSFPNLAGRRLTASHETLLWGHAGRQRKYHFDYPYSKSFVDASDGLKAAGKQMRTVWDIPNNKTRDELAFGKHPTQKPLRILDRIVRLSSKPGDLVLVPFAGSGSECVAAATAGRRYLGFEIDRDYHRIAISRLGAIKQ